MKNIIFVAGPPGSGKTEFIKRYGFNEYRVFDLDNYRKLDKSFSINNPLKYSESTTKDAGLMMNMDINSSLLDDSTIVIETTFSSFNNTLEQVKKINNYQIFVYLFVVNEIEAYVSILERYIINYNNGNLCRMISFEKYLKKFKFYDEYIDIIKNYNININYVSRNGSIINLFKYRPTFDNYYNIEHYIGRINKIKQFCNQNNIPELHNELDKMLRYFQNYDKMKKVIKMINEKSCGAIVELDGKVLLVRQKKSGNIGFPKGHILPDESEIEASIRETKEETNIDIEICNNKRYSLSYVQNENVNKEVVYFLAKPKGNFEISMQESEIEDVFWVDKEKVRETLTYENLRQVWDQVLKD